MKKVFNTFIKALLIVVILAIGYIAVWNIWHYNPKTPEVDTLVIRDTTTLIIWKDRLIPYQVVKYDTLTKTDSIYLFMNDSAECIAKLVSLYKQYEAKKYFNDTLMNNDTLALIVVKVKVSQNNIDSLGIVYKNNRPTTIITSKKYINYLYGNVTIGKNIIMPNLTYNTSKFNLGLGYDIPSSSFCVIAGYKIKSW